MSTHYVELDTRTDHGELVVRADCSCGWVAPHWEHSADYDGAARRAALAAIRAAKDVATAHAPVLVFEPGLPV